MTLGHLDDTFSLGTPTALDGDIRIRSGVEEALLRLSAVRLRREVRVVFVVPAENDADALWCEHVSRGRETSRCDPSPVGPAP